MLLKNFLVILYNCILVVYAGIQVVESRMVLEEIIVDIRTALHLEQVWVQNPLV